jgi:hypothetical protein
MKKLIALVCFIFILQSAFSQDTDWETIENRLHQLVIEFADYRKTYPNKTEIFEIDKESGFLYNITYIPFERIYYMSLWFTVSFFPEYSFQDYHIPVEQKRSIISSARRKFEALYEETQTKDFWDCSLSSSWYRFVAIPQEYECIMLSLYESSL